ncbi:MULTISPECIES: D-aminoacyl-tRNA deacylase [unclassified Mitsuokella]|uniref:D-aminoacyl-tRNA deacylase n=1 Tax=unclassified Mitsuokella TaxID=2637239 RepID=UPI000E4C731D|nr:MULTISPECIES: D-aminoacyl-tRNA deacylase [unclassified Mitsuokella]RGS72994.1 D-tyrosyl-tRNA(Tyr) deacylase [Mitsuokella sp. AF21-1AC]RHM54055.1 D-tyrosyl-tRNA(Tyr) deacylase [Mitsuokella sp. AF33-22]
MKAVVTRVTSASVTIEGTVRGRIENGFLVLLGVGPEDTEEVCDHLAEKVAHVRVFSDEAGKMNKSIDQVGGAFLVISQFTLYADLKKRRPGFSHAAKPELAEPLYERFMADLRAKGFHVEHGEFGAEMQVASVNDGPVTLLFDTDEV